MHCVHAPMIAHTQCVHHGKQDVLDVLQAVHNHHTVDGQRATTLCGGVTVSRWSKTVCGWLAPHTNACSIGCTASNTSSTPCL